MTRADAHNISPSTRAETQQRFASVRWRIGSQAARAAFSVNSNRVFLELRLREQPDGRWRGEVLLDSGEAEPRVLRDVRPAVRWLRDEDRGMMHVEADTFLHATIAVNNGTPALVYARTDMLAELGLGGGRYEPVGVDLDLRADRSVA